MLRTPVALMKEQVIERDREIARLKHELAKQADGSLFDLKHDSADDCAGAIVGKNWRKAAATSSSPRLDGI